MVSDVSAKPEEQPATKGELQAEAQVRSRQMQLIETTFNSINQRLLNFETSLANRDAEIQRLRQELDQARAAVASTQQEVARLQQS